jgi:RES domain-containing protein
MGRAKHEWMEEQERGWSDPGTNVCATCVGEPFLSALIRPNASALRCDYCGTNWLFALAAPASIVIEAVAHTVRAFYADPTEAGVPYDGGFAFESMNAREMLYGFPLECSDNFFEALADAFHGTYWVQAANGHWASSQRSQELDDAWSSFEHLVKHQTRFHFADQSDPDSREPTATALLAEIGDMLEELGAIHTIDANTVLHRVRIREPGSEWIADAATMGAPPSELARAGRMNPAGISYFYSALDGATALAEVVVSPPVGVVLAQFSLSHDVRVLDLGNLPDMPSIFDPTARGRYQSLSFANSFVHAISRPVAKDGREHIEYVPSQVVCEWFAQIFKEREAGTGLHGLLYPSAVAPGGRNVVLFPSSRRFDHQFESIDFVSAEERTLGDWDKVSSALGFAPVSAKPRAAGRKQ